MREGLKIGDYGYRRKRNMRLINKEDDGELSTGIDWTRPSNEPAHYEEEPEEYDNEELIEDYEEVEESDIDTMMVGTKPVNLDKLRVKEEKQEIQKITIYLDKSLVAILKMLKKEKRINSYSSCIKEALQAYLTRE